jgi:hypothetical protein
MIDRVPRFARPFVAWLVAMMAASAIFVWEPWPFTSFRLFSQLRAPDQGAWSATAVLADGEEVAYPLGGLPRGFRGFSFVMPEFVGADAQRRKELCRTWVDAAPELIGRRAIRVNVYFRRWDLSKRSGDRALPGTNTLIYICTLQGSADAG